MGVGPAEVRGEEPGQEALRGARGGLSQDEDAGQAIGAGRVAGSDLPDLAHALELPDVEAVEADKRAGGGGFDVARFLAAGLVLAAGALGQQARPVGAVMVEDAEALEPGVEPDATQDSVDRARRNRHALAGELEQQVIRTPGRP
jgi:hypothetical protein